MLKMKPLKIDQLHNACLAIGELKQQLIEELPHYGHQALYLQNDEITTGQLNNKTEIKINLLTGHLLYFHNEKGHFIDLFHDNIPDKFKEIMDQYNLEFPKITLENIPPEQLASFQEFSTHGKRILEFFRMTLRRNFTLIHLWPHHFDFSVEWFTGNKDEQIGTGLSPGDEQYPYPYLYMNPSPFNDKIKENELPIGKWHDSGWNGIKVEWTDLLQYSTPDAAKKISELFLIAKKNFSEV